MALGVLSNATPDGIHRSPCITQTLLKESFELNPKQRIFDSLVLTLMLVPTKADPTAEEQSCK